LRLPPKILERAMIGIGTDGSGLWSGYNGIEDSVAKQKQEILKSLNSL
jgi:hypothetical protein